MPLITTTVATDVINELFDTFPNTVHIMVNIEPQIEKDSFTFLQDNTINEMVQTNSHRFNTHFKHISLSASVVIIIITRLLETSRIITQYYNHLLLYNFTTSPSKLMRHHQFSKYAIHGLEHSETDMNF